MTLVVPNNCAYALGSGSLCLRASVVDIAFAVALAFSNYELTYNLTFHVYAMVHSRTRKDVSFAPNDARVTSAFLSASVLCKAPGRD
jgi:hypothetical protein